MPDVFRQSLLDFQSVPPIVVLVRLVAALLLGWIVALVYRVTRSQGEVAPPGIHGSRWRESWSWLSQRS